MLSSAGQLLSKSTVTSSVDAPSGSPIIVIKGLIKQFGRFAALRGVSGSFDGGKLYAILGDNGAGKTTLLRTLAGLNRPSRGSVTMLGSPDLRASCREIGYMAHPSLLYDEMSGMENLAYFAGLYGLPTSRVAAKLLPRSISIPDLERPVGQYSQGMRQRMSLARAILNDPRLLSAR